MKALLWKDCRVNRFVLMFGLVVLLLPYATGGVLRLYSHLRYEQPLAFDPLNLIPVAFMSLGASLLTIAMLGGNAFAAERMDRSAEFLAYLPPTRRAVLGSKAIVAFSAGLIIWLINLAAVYVAVHMAGGVAHLQLSDGSRPFDMLLTLAAISAAVLGAAWLTSTVSASPAIATGAGLFAPLLMAGVLQALQYFFNLDFDFPAWLRVSLLLLGVVCCGTGTAYHLQRVEP